MAYKQKHPYLMQILYVIKFWALEGVKKWQKKSCLKGFHSVGIYPAGFPSDRMKVEMVGWYTKIWGGGFQKSGIPDLICCVNGVMLAVEVKASNGRPSELQKLNISRINTSGGIGVFLYPEGFDEFKNLMKGVINCGIHIPALIALKNANASSKCVIFKD